MRLSGAGVHVHESKVSPLAGASVLKAGPKRDSGAGATMTMTNMNMNAKDDTDAGLTTTDRSLADI
jgi:hypothetical protein